MCRCFHICRDTIAVTSYGLSMVHGLATRKKRASENSDRKGLLNPKLARDVTFENLRYYNKFSVNAVAIKN